MIEVYNSTVLYIHCVKTGAYTIIIQEEIKRTNILTKNLTLLRAYNTNVENYGAVKWSSKTL